MVTIVTGELYESIDGKLFEIKRQLRQKNGYLFNPNSLNFALQELIEGRFSFNKPQPIVKNQHGHYIIIATGLNLTGAEEYTRRKNLGDEMSVYAHQVLTSAGPNSYDAKHRLKAGKEYRLAVVPGKLVSTKWTTRNLQAYGASFGYQNVLAGHILRVCEIISGKQMEKKMDDICYIAGLHDPIKDFVGNPYTLLSCWNGDASQLGARLDYYEGVWGGGGAFAFVDPQVGA
jgi:hypothetical protein